MLTGVRKKALVVVLGPTASGKSSFAVELAKRLDAPVVSCDSRQFYREIPIGTAAPSAEEQCGVPHYFIGTRSIAEPYNCGMYEADALKLLDLLFESNDTVIMVGGSGLYIDAVCYGMDDFPQADAVLREELQSRLLTEGLPSLLADLERLDPDFYAVVDRNNPARVTRALEVCISTGRPYSAQRGGTPKERSFRIVKVGIEIPREELYERIDRRVDIMLEQGLENEARQVYPYRELNALQTVGYRELFDYFSGNTGYDEAVELIKRNSRRYAKRQLTWFGRDETILWIKKDDILEVEKMLKNLPE